MLRHLVNTNEVQPDWCYFRNSNLYLNIGRLPDDALGTFVEDDDDETLRDVKKYRKKWAKYEIKLRQYEINMEVYRAWKLKEKKDKLIEQMKLLEKQMSNLQVKVDQVDQTIEEVVFGEEVADEGEV